MVHLQSAHCVGKPHSQRQPGQASSKPRLVRSAVHLAAQRAQLLQRRVHGASRFEHCADPPGCPQDCGLPPHTCPAVTSGASHADPSPSSRAGRAATTLAGFRGVARGSASVCAEDCLFLNVFSPKTVPHKLPVVAFIHGGNFKQGEWRCEAAEGSVCDNQPFPPSPAGYSGGLLYDCSFMASQHNVVCVTLNYRLGVLGSLYTGTGEGQLAGNFGFQDQQLALQWIKENIAAFGGDPENVNIFGQSAGAASVALHNVAPSSKSLFSKSYMLSEPLALPLRTPGTWGPIAAAFTKYANCTGGDSATELACLMGKSAEDIVTAQVDALHDVLDEWPRLLELFMPWTPTVQTPLIPHRPIDGFHNGQLADMTKPAIATTVANEALLFIYEAFGKPMSSLEYEVVVDVVFLGNGGKVKKQFPLPDNMKTDARPWVSHIGTLALFVCPTRYAMAGMTAPAYVGHFDHVMSFGKEVWGPEFQECDPYVCHGGDLPFIFHPNASALNLAYTPGEQNLSMSMQSYWTSMASGGVPLPPVSGVDAGIPWHPFNMTTQSYLRLDTPANSEQTFTFKEECDFFDSIGYNFY